MSFGPIANWSTLPAIVVACCLSMARAEEPNPGQPRDNNTMTSSTKQAKTNRLINATSPYLLQHAHNPVDWYEWGPEALEKAKQEDKPIFLSIGYAACHWCHVMEHECFEIEEVAQVLNEHFVSIKVDREERPDLDEIYMAFTQASNNGNGGWPMSVWLVPDTTPFFAGTYYPREQFLGTLRSIGQAWRNDRDRITNAAAGAKSFFERWSAPPTALDEVLPVGAIGSAAKIVAGLFDKSRGGISGGGTNKFPPSAALELLLRANQRAGESELLEIVDTTLDHMSRGGIYDHLGGGICRYSTDVEWLVPHFEKMLYDQATVSSVYLDGYQVFNNPHYAAVAADIFDYVLGDLQMPEGGFYSSRDADSEGLEGKFYIWTVEQVVEVLGEKDGELFCFYYDVTKNGNWYERLGHAPAGPKNILHISKPADVFAKAQGIDPRTFDEQLASWRGKMLDARARRVPPGLDDKVLTAWNGLMIASLAKGACVLGEPKYAQSAARAADFVLQNLRKDGRLLRSYRKGEAHLTGYLDDYAYLIDGLLNLYEATFDQRWVEEADALTKKAIEFFHDPKAGGFFFTAKDGEKLIARSKQPHDGPIPSANAVQARNLVRLAILTGNKKYHTIAESIFLAFGSQAQRSPTAFESLLIAADLYHGKVTEIAVVGPLGLSDTQALLRTVYQGYLPNKVLVQGAGSGKPSDLPLLRGKTMKNGKATAYVCENYNCKTPVTNAAELKKQLFAAKRAGN